MIPNQIIHCITRLQAHYRGYQVRKLFNRSYQQFCLINDRIVASVNEEWKHQAGGMMDYRYSMSLGVDFVEEDGIRFPLFLPLEDLLWNDVKSYQESVKIKKEEEDLVRQQRIKQLEDECQSLESYIRQRIEKLIDKQTGRK